MVDFSWGFVWGCDYVAVMPSQAAPAGPPSAHSSLPLLKYLNMLSKANDSLTRNERDQFSDTWEHAKFAHKIHNLYM
jgi:hypothetical protein